MKWPAWLLGVAFRAGGGGTAEAGIAGEAGSAAAETRGAAAKARGAAAELQEVSDTVAAYMSLLRQLDLRKHKEAVVTTGLWHSCCDQGFVCSTGQYKPVHAGHFRA